MDKEALREKLKTLSAEDRKLFQEALQEDSAEEGLLPEEVSTLREMLGEWKMAKEKPSKKKKGENILDMLFGGE